MPATVTKKPEQKVVPSQQTVRPEVMDAFEQSVARNSELLRLLAK